MHCLFLRPTPRSSMWHLKHNMISHTSCTHHVDLPNWLHPPITCRVNPNPSPGHVLACLCVTRPVSPFHPPRLVGVAHDAHLKKLRRIAAESQVRCLGLSKRLSQFWPLCPCLHQGGSGAVNNLWRPMSGLGLAGVVIHWSISVFALHGQACCAAACHSCSCNLNVRCQQQRSAE